MRSILIKFISIRTLEYHLEKFFIQSNFYETHSKNRFSIKSSFIIKSVKCS